MGTLSLAEQIRALVQERGELTARLVEIDHALNECREVVGELGRMSIPQPETPLPASTPAPSTPLSACCAGYTAETGVVDCNRRVTRKAGRRGPTRCPDCTLAQKRSNVRKSLRKGRAETKTLVQRIESSPEPPQPLRAHDARGRAQPPRPIPLGSVIARKGGRAPERQDVEFQRYIQQHPGVSSAELADALVATRPMVKRKLSILTKANLVHCVGKTTAARWFPGPPLENEEKNLQTVWRGKGPLPGGAVAGAGSSLSPSTLAAARH